jgi:hypothetical protein
MALYALVSGNQVMYSDGTKVTVKPKKQSPRKKAIKVGSTVMVNFDSECIAVTTAKRPDGWFEFEIIQGKDKNKKSACHKKLLTLID